MAPDLSFLNRLAPADPVPDAELLRRYAAAGDGPAFELLVRRHAGLVWRVCRSVLAADAHAAEDAFQASFLALARRADRVRGASAAGWLARVARHAALRRRRLLARSPGGLPADLPAAPRPDSAEASEVSAAVLAEVARLPDRFREPVLLCLLEGCSHAEAATRLGLPVGTVASRLSRAKGRLRGRLVRRGLAPAALVAVAPAPAAVVRAGVAVGLAPSSASPAVATLAAGVVSAMSAVFRLKVAAGLVLAAGVATLSLAVGPGATPPPPAQPAPAADDLAKLQGKWTVVSIKVAGKQSTADDVKGMSWTISGDAVETDFGPAVGRKSGGKLSLEPAKSPRWIDLSHPDPAGKPVVSLGIYELAGDRLTVCYRDPDMSKRLGRPAEFAVDGEAMLVSLARDGTDPPPAAPLPPPKPVVTPADELAKIQGEWRFLRWLAADYSPTPAGLTLTIAGDIGTYGPPEPRGPSDRMRFALDPAHSPKRVELTILPVDKAGPDAGTVLRGIYKLDGDRLLLCVRDPETLEQFGRPTAFVGGGRAKVAELVRADSPSVTLAGLQGDWKLVAGSVDGYPLRWETLIGRRARVLEGVMQIDNVVWAGERYKKYALVPRPDHPGEIDLVALTGRDAVRGQTFPGRYELDGDKLTLCVRLTTDQKVARPADVRHGPGYTVFVMERDAPGAKLVGEWQLPMKMKQPGDTLLVWTFRDTGIYRIDYLDLATGRVNADPATPGPVVGRWRVDGTDLVLEAESWIGDKHLPHRHVERLPIEALTGDTLTVRRLPDPRGTRWVTDTYTRFPGWGKIKP